MALVGSIPIFQNFRKENAIVKEYKLGCLSDIETYEVSVYHN